MVCNFKGKGVRSKGLFKEDEEYIMCKLKVVATDGYISEYECEECDGEENCIFHKNNQK